jgi:hypothetical protein
MRILSDTGPIVAAADRRDPAHTLAAELVTQLGTDLIIIDVVMVEVDQLLRSRASPSKARVFQSAVASGYHGYATLTPGLLNRAVEIDAQYADLNLGLVDASIMAYAERHKLPILTFDFRDFRATKPREGEWRLVVDEAGYRRMSRASGE